MDNSAPIMFLQPKVETYHASEVDNCVFKSSSTNSDRANVTTQRARPKESQVKSSESAVMDRWSDSGYSSYGARTISSVGSMSSFLGAHLTMPHSPSNSG
jgi:hypothetical protein